MALGKPMQEMRAAYLARLRKLEDGYTKRLTFGQDEVSSYRKVSVDRAEADISSKFVTDTIANQNVSDVFGEAGPKVRDDLAIDDMMFDYPLVTHPCESHDNDLLAVYNLAQLNTQIIQLEGVNFLKSVYHSYPR